MQVPEPRLFVLHNCYTPYLSTVILQADGSLLAGAWAVSVSLRLVTICSLSMSQTREEKHFSPSLIIQASPFEGLISLLSMLHSHRVDTFVQLLRSQVILSMKSDIDQLICCP